MLRHALLTFFSFSLLGTDTLASEREPLSIFIGGDADLNDDQVPLSSGARQLLEYLREETQLAIKPKVMQWKRALLLTQDGKGLLYGAAMTPERQQSLHFSQPLYAENVWLITRCDRQFSFHSVADLRGKTLGMLAASSFGPEVDEAKDKLFKTDYDMNMSRARFQKLLKQRTDAVFYYSQYRDLNYLEDEVNARYGNLAKQETAPLRNKPFCFLPNPVTTTPLYIAAAHGHFEAEIQLINTALQKARLNGKLAQIFSPTHKPEGKSLQHP